MWRFVQVSDPHLGSQTDGQWNNRFLCSMMPEVMGCLRKDLAQLQPDFVLATGDIASGQTQDAVFAARDLMDSLHVTYYPVGGNHDFVTQGSRALFLDAFGQHLPNADTVYSFTHKNLHFCVLDPWWQWSDGSLCPCSERSVAANLDTTLANMQWAVPPHQLAWLDDDLTQNAGIPTALAFHYPAVPIPKRLAHPGMQDAGHLSNGELLFEILTGHPQVKVLFSGHVHMHFIEPVGAVTQVVTGALPEFPTEYRDIAVYEDRIEITTRGLSNGAFARRSLIPGKEWVAGQPCDRTATIALT